MVLVIKCVETWGIIASWRIIAKGRASIVRCWKPFAPSVISIWVSDIVLSCPRVNMCPFWVTTQIVYHSKCIRMAAILGASLMFSRHVVDVFPKCKCFNKLSRSHTEPARIPIQCCVTKKPYIRVSAIVNNGVMHTGSLRPASH